MAERNVNPMKPPSESPSELDVQKIKDGDEEELRKLFEILMPMARVTALHFSRKNFQIDADDLAQEVIIRIYRYLPKIEPSRLSENFRTWCFVVVRNTATDLVRRMRANSISSLSIDEVDIDADSLAKTNDVNRMEREILLEEAINSLSESERIIMSAVLSGKSIREVAGELGISHAAAYVRFRDATKTLAALILPELQSANREAS